jgi:proline dehydrogenase
VLRAILLYLSNASWARAIVTGWGLARRMASRFIAGDEIEAALQVVKSLNDSGLYASLDHLGENVTNTEESIAATDAYIEIMQRLQETGVRANCSLKLSQLGLALDTELALGNMRCIAKRAREFGIMVRIDMEDSSTVEDTLAIQRTLHEEGLTNIGLVIQAYLYRSEQDVRNLVSSGTRIRLCKGAYNEPASVAFPKKNDVDANFDRLASIMIDAALQQGSEPSGGDGTQPPLAAIATHDEQRIEHARRYADQIGLPKSALEFQMLHGIRTDLQESLAAEGYPVRIYIPYGTEWYPYFMRRLAERPANLWFFLSAFFKR